MLKLFFSTILLFSVTTFSQINLFSYSNIDYNVLTKSSENTLALDVDKDKLTLIKETKPCEFELNIPFFNNEVLKLKLESFDIYTHDFQLIRNTHKGTFIEDYMPKIFSYRILGDSISGTISFMKDNIIAVIKYNNTIYELKGAKDEIYVLFDVADSIEEFSFECQTENIDIDTQTINYKSNNSSTECVKMGIDTDYYTFLEFNSDCYSVVEWSIALMTGVSEVYMQELNEEFFLQIRYINVREAQDNYFPFDDCADMLDEVSEYWTSAPLNTLQSEVDLIHLLTRKEANGGIAWLNQLCEPFNDYYKCAVSSGLNVNINYNYPENTPFSWNFFCISHEIGHNFGANHTHWCGWESEPSLGFGGGAIDSCYPVEGSCASPGQPEVPTIMSYCHLDGLTPTLQFNEIVKLQALLPNMDDDCYGECMDFETSCEGNFIFGCTDEYADNYNPDANIDDNSCFCINQYEFSINDSYGDGLSSNNTGGNNPNYYIIGSNGSDFVEMTNLNYGNGETYNFCFPSNINCFDFYLSTDYWSSEVSWEIIGPDGNVVDSGGNYSNGGITINETYCFSDCTDSDDDGICDENEIIGCQTFFACNYNPNATEDDGSCIFPTEYYLDCNGDCLLEIPNLSDTNEINYTDNDSDDDGVCNQFDNCSNTYNPNQEDADDNGVGDLCENVVGCTDVTACNYNQEASIDCNCCTYPQEYLDCDGNCLYDINENDICDELEIGGCIDSSACNYNELANTDDGSCEYENDCNSCTGDLSCFGCTDDNACNFNFIATLDDNTCIYPNECGSCTGDLSCLGCTDDNACNFNFIATIEDNSCIYPIEFYDCNGNCLSDQDNDSVCDELDNCINDFNPNQIDTDNDGYGDECSCEQINIVGETLSVEGSVVTYDIANQLSNNYSWSVVNGEIIWDSATDTSVSILWGEQGVGTVIITQIYGDGLNCDTTLDVVIIPNNVNIDEEKYHNEVIRITDILGRDVSKFENDRVLIIHYVDGKVEKIYNVKK